MKGVASFEEYSKIMESYDRVYCDVNRRDYYVRKNRLDGTIENLKDLESMYWSLVQARNRLQLGRYKDAYDAISNLRGKGHCLTKDSKRWIEYDCGEYGISTNYIDKDVTNRDWIEDQEAKEFRCCYDRLCLCNLRLSTMRYFLKVVFDDYNRNNEGDCKLPGKLRQFVLNDRIYFYQSGYNRHGVLQWSEVFFPEQDMEVIQ